MLTKSHDSASSTRSDETVPADATSEAAERPDRGPWLGCDSLKPRGGRHHIDPSNRLQWRVERRPALVSRLRAVVSR